MSFLLFVRWSDMRHVGIELVYVTLCGKLRKISVWIPY